MKSILTLVLTLFISVLCLAQNGINYKAIIKDANGNVLVSSPVSIQFIIYEGAALTNNVYQESHTINTDANGLIVVNIGEGITANVFTNINWANDDHFLNTKINTGAGLVDIGTTEFKTVPYAINAETAANVTGLEALDEGNGIGWRIKGRDPNNSGNIGLYAMDLSYYSAANTFSGATGSYSTSMGYATVASGIVSSAIGSGTRALGDNSTALGTFTIAFGSYSTAMGNSTKAQSLNSTALGQFNIGGGNAITWVATDPLFEIGNGIDNASRTNALTVLKNGTILAPSFDLAEITNPKALITKEYADTNLGATGLEAINEGNGIGWRLKGQDPNNYGNIGSKAVDLSYSSIANTTRGATGNYTTAMGLQTTASGPASTAMGYETTASGVYSTAMGDGTYASGNNSTAMGFYNTASGQSSTAMGSLTIASGNTSTAMGLQTTASGNQSTAMGDGTYATGINSTAMGSTTRATSYASLAIGRYNVGGGNATSWVDTDPLFEVGFGYAGPTVRRNAITVLKNGKVGIGTATPSTFLHLTNGYDASLTNGAGYFLIGQETGTNMVFDNNEISVRNNGAASNLFLQQDGGNVYVGGTLAHSSDRRLKKDITPLTYGLETILQLNPVQYNWINRTQDYKSIGLIAQEVQPVISEIVHEEDDEAKTLSVSYTELIPILINAVKDLKAENDALKSRIEALEKK